MTIWRAGRKGLDGSGIRPGRGSLLGSGRRNASPQPAELTVDELQAKAQAEMSLEERRVPLDQLLYQLHQLKNRAMQSFMRESKGMLGHSNLDKQKDSSDINRLLLPLKILEERSSKGDVAADWFRQLQIELKAEKSSQEKRELYRNTTIERGAGAELPSSQGLIEKWRGPLADVIFQEQKLILHCVKAHDRNSYGPYMLLAPASDLAKITLSGIISAMLSSEQMGLCKTAKPAMDIGKAIQQQVRMEMVKSKAKRLKRQHQALYDQVKGGEPEEVHSSFTEAQDWTTDWYNAWLKKLDMDPARHHEMERKTWKEDLLKQIKEIKPYSLPDPAASQPEMPLSNVAVVTHTDHEILERYRAEKDRILRIPKTPQARAWAEKLGVDINKPRPKHYLPPADQQQLRLVERQIAIYEGRAAKEEDMGKRQAELLEFEAQRLRYRMEKYGTSDKRQINQLNMMLNRALKASATWPQEKIVKIGARLMDLAIQTLTTTVRDPVTGETREEPALEHKVLMSARARKQGMIRLHDDITDTLANVRDLKHVQQPLYQPMVVPPLPWLGVKFGAYLYCRSRIMRTKGNQAQVKALEEADRSPDHGLSQIYEALNALGATPWRVNTGVLDVLEEALSRKLEICKLPAYKSKPITPPANRPRFVTWPGGFHEPMANKLLTSVQKSFDELSLEAPMLRDPPLLELEEPEAPKLDARESRRLMHEAWREPVEPITARAITPRGEWQRSEGSSVVKSLANMEPSLVRENDGDEGTPLSRMGPKAKMVFRRTQMQVTFTREETTAERKERRLENAKIRKFNRENYSLRCDLNYKMQTARDFSDEPAIYFPHSLDFRGRAYPMHPHLNHLGSDMCRGVLEFAEGKPLGRDGLDWLFIQLANVWGNKVDKRNYEGRMQFVREHLEDVQASAEAPLENTWWQAAESPWQALAVCREITGALASGDPASFISHTPIMMDGSCNGLQHYAALGLDHAGGTSVNLTSMDEPQDVYSEVAEIVRRRVAEDMEKGVPLAKEVLAEVDRKLVKQTVMTSVYGVTISGAKDQITNRLRERGYKAKSGAKDAYMAGSYAAKKVLEGLDERFGKANRVMGWLADCARAICKTEKPVQWETRLGLPVVQPYTNRSKVHVSTSLQRIVLVRAEKPTDTVQKIKQRTAFPPNFVHSIDSTHMMMTAIACARAGITFAGVHDSFWTHACTTPQMNQILREKFVELYSQPILEDLRASFQERYPDARIPELPEKGDLNITDVLESQYFFS